jgi:hypothetical protein|tara:strand:- start:3886 stop:4437 length:552 start_codon:yes stop_codon:yes gene_type:complete
LPIRARAIGADVDRPTRVRSNAACVRIAAAPARPPPPIVRALFFPLSDVARAPELVRAHAHVARIAAIRERFQRVPNANRTRASRIARLPTDALRRFARRRDAFDAASRLVRVRRFAPFARASRSRASPCARRARARTLAAVVGRRANDRRSRRAPSGAFARPNARPIAMTREINRITIRMSE